MDRIPIDTLLQPCAADGGVGQNLEYDSRHLSMCEQAEGVPEQEYGQTLVAAQEPDWRKLFTLAHELSIETRDLRVAVLMTESLVRLQGFQGLSDGLRLIAGWTEKFWADVYPQLDPLDDLDPVERVGALNRLCHGSYLLAGLHRLPLAQDAALGSVTLRDLRHSHRSEASSDTLTRPEVEAIFLSAPLESLRSTGNVIQDCIETLEHLSEFLDGQIGNSHWDASPLLNALRECSSAVENAYGQRGGVVHRAPSCDVANVGGHAGELEGQAPDNQTGASSLIATPASQAGPSLERSFAIENRAEAMAVLDRLCDYFEKHEPASPVPLLLQRAKRLVPMSFVEILRELAPNGLDQAMQSVGALFGEKK
jgi:type VI secretion system protein ImpA